jgi:hypothetical protein
MRRTSILIGSVLTLALSGAAWAKSVDDLVASGFVVFRAATGVVGDFEGCERDRQVPLVGGGTFTCSSFGYMHAHNPKAVLLKGKDGKFKLVIQGTVFDGNFS